jgi:hypothetical protein
MRTVLRDGRETIEPDAHDRERRNVVSLAVGISDSVPSLANGARTTTGMSDVVALRLLIPQRGRLTVARVKKSVPLTGVQIFITGRRGGHPEHLSHR